MEVVSMQGPNREHGYFMQVDFADGRSVWVYPRIYGSIIARGQLADFGSHYDEEWSYERLGQAISAAIRWVLFYDTMPEPEGWVRHKSLQTNQTRRRTGGDPATERIED